MKIRLNLTILSDITNVKSECFDTAAKIPMHYLKREVAFRDFVDNLEIVMNSLQYQFMRKSKENIKVRPIPWCKEEKKCF